MGDQDRTLNDVIGLVLNITIVINAVVMVSFLTFSFTKKFWKNLLGRFEFSNTVLNTQGPGYKIIPSWDLDLGVKHRVWHAFWDSFMLKLCGETDGEEDSNPVAERMLGLKEETRSFGLDKIKMHWEGVADPAIAAARMACLREWEGVDVFWDDGSKTLDWQLDSQTFFAKLYVSDYPFHIRAIYDDSTDVTCLWDNVDLVRFVELQNREDIVARRGVRQRLRALAEDAGLFSLPFSRLEKKTVEDGTRTVTDSKGNKTKQTVYSTIEVMIYYTMGKVFVESNNDDLPMQAGFKSGMKYDDGYGEGVAPRTGKTKKFKNESATMPASHVGVGDGTFALNERPQEVFKAAESLLEGALPALLERHQEYRDTLMRTRSEANQTLSDGFCYYIYNNPKLSLAQLEHYLANNENNPVLREKQSKHSEGLSFLYKRIQYCTPSLCSLVCFLGGPLGEQSDDLRAQGSRGQDQPGLAEQRRLPPPAPRAARGLAVGVGAHCWRVLRAPPGERQDPRRAVRPHGPRSGPPLRGPRRPRARVTPHHPNVCPDTGATVSPRIVFTLLLPYFFA